ncbi:hypothetical protein NPIL_665111, partial [Nephila pilipes]
MVSNATIPKSSLDNNNLRRCQKIQYHTEEYTLSVQGQKLRRLSKYSQLIPFLYRPGIMNISTDGDSEMERGDNQNR